MSNENSTKPARPRCFACGRPMGQEHSRYLADTRDGQVVWVGASCMSEILSAGEAGWQPPKGGPRLWRRTSSETGSGK
jgi:hypothetical protein